MLGLIEKTKDELKSLAQKAVNKGKYNVALAAVSACATIEYDTNQHYTDSVLEDILRDICKKIVSVPKEYSSAKNTVIFYDGFGLDLRGWALAYLNALTELNYRVVYIAPSRVKETIPTIRKVLESNGSEAVFIDTSLSYTQQIKALNNLFNEKRPSTAFFYTYPNDVAGTVIFNGYQKLVKRIQIDLTDHAFWLGVNACDYFIECRVPGVSNAIYERGVDVSRVLKLDCCLYISDYVDPAPMPFDIDSRRFFFSGGDLYKTLGDEKLLYYSIVDRVLNEYGDLLFVYAGKGDTSQLELLAQKYPDRVYFIAERKDFYRLMEKCVFYLNTYPMFGGLMMRYAAHYGKIPVTLKHDSDHEGILLNQEDLGIDFDNVDELLAEIRHILDDGSYASIKGERLKKAIVSPEKFRENIRLIVEESRTEYVFDEVPHIDTIQFRKEYLNRYESSKLQKAIVTRANLSLFPYYPLMFIKNVLRRH